MRRARLRLTIVIVLLTSAWAIVSGTIDIAAGQSDAAEIEAPSIATSYLFKRPHLANITSPAVLRYGFHRSDLQGDGFTDTIDVKIDAIRDDGRRDTSFEFFTGPRQRPYPALPNFFGNPLVIVFLQRDVWALSRARGGQARYFRYRIRQALRDKATVEPMTIKTTDGSIVAAQKISIRPYENDRYRKRLEQFEFKTYEFVTSDDIPGEIYMIRTTVPLTRSQIEGSKFLVQETVVFEEQRAYENGAAPK